MAIIINLMEFCFQCTSCGIVLNDRFDVGIFLVLTIETACHKPPTVITISKIFSWNTLHTWCVPGSGVVRSASSRSTSTTPRIGSHRRSDWILRWRTPGIGCWGCTLGHGATPWVCGWWLGRWLGHWGTPWVLYGRCPTYTA